MEKMSKDFRKQCSNPVPNCRTTLCIGSLLTIANSSIIQNFCRIRIPLCLYGACRTATKSCIDNECSFVSQSQSAGSGRSQKQCRSSSRRAAAGNAAPQRSATLSSAKSKLSKRRIPSHNVRGDELVGGKSGGIRRERCLNGERRRQTPLPIHLVIESGDHTPIKKTHLGHSSRLYATLTFQATTEGVYVEPFNCNSAYVARLSFFPFFFLIPKYFRIDLTRCVFD